MNSPAVAVDLDAQAEGLEDRALQLRIGVDQLGGQVGKRRQHSARVVGIDGGAVASGLVELLENRLCFLALAFEAADALADNDRVDARLDRGELALDLLVDLAELARNPLPRGVALRLQRAGKGCAFGLEVGQRFRAEDPGGEETVDQVGQLVLAHVLPFAVADRLGRAVAIGGAIAAGV